MSSYGQGCGVAVPFCGASNFKKIRITTRKAKKYNLIILISIITIINNLSILVIDRKFVVVYIVLLSAPIALYNKGLKGPFK
jgi:hypothetical protein